MPQSSKRKIDTIKSFSLFAFFLLFSGITAYYATSCSSGESDPVQEQANDGESNQVSDESLWFRAGPDPVAVAPDNYTVLIDAGFIRMVHLNLPAGTAVGTHSHPPSAMYVPQDCELLYTQADGSERRLTFHAGLCIFAEPISDRQLANQSDTDAELLFMELRDTTRREFAGPDPLKYDKLRFSKLLDNKQMRCLSLKLAAGDSTQIVALRPFVAWMKSGESIVLQQQSNRQITEFSSKTAPAFSSSSGEPFRFVNKGENPIHLIIAEDK